MDTQILIDRARTSNHKRDGTNAYGTVSFSCLLDTSLGARTYVPRKHARVERQDCVAEGTRRGKQKGG